MPWSAALGVVHDRTNQDLHPLGNWKTAVPFSGNYVDVEHHGCRTAPAGQNPGGCMSACVDAFEGVDIQLTLDEGVLGAAAPSGSSGVIDAWLPAERAALADLGRRLRPFRRRYVLAEPPVPRLPIKAMIGDVKATSPTLSVRRYFTVEGME
jgi:hypothetical protein